MFSGPRANASDALTEFASKNGTFEQLFASLDTDKKGYVLDFL